MILAALLLAQIEHAPAESIKTAIIIGLAGLAGAGMIRNLFWPAAAVNVRQPLEVREADRYVTRDEFIRYQGDIGARLVKLEGEISSLRIEIRGDAVRIHQRIDDLPSQLVAILRNTGAINPSKDT
jgi:hypothetical protein